MRGFNRFRPRDWVANALINTELRLACTAWSCRSAWIAGGFKRVNQVVVWVFTIDPIFFTTASSTGGFAHYFLLLFAQTIILPFIPKPKLEALSANPFTFMGNRSFVLWAERGDTFQWRHKNSMHRKASNYIVTPLKFIHHVVTRDNILAVYRPESRSMARRKWLGMGGEK